MRRPYRDDEVRAKLADAVANLKLLPVTMQPGDRLEVVLALVADENGLHAVPPEGMEFQWVRRGPGAS